MAEDYKTVKISNLPEALSVSDNDCFLIVQNRNAKRCRPSLMKGEKGNPGESAYLQYNGQWVQWKLGVNGSWVNLIPVEDIYGPSAYEVAVRNGYTGTEAEWVASLSEASEKAAEIALEAARVATETNEAVTGNEKSRVEAEAARIKAENERDTAEKERNESEDIRNNAELSRGNAEKEREDAENARVRAEAGRVEAENKRVEDTADRLQAVDEATDRLNDLSDHREYIGDGGFWYRWNEETKEFENTGKTSKGNLMYATFAYRKGRIYMRTDPEYTGPKFKIINGRMYVVI